MRSDDSANYLVPYDEQFANRAKKIRCRRCGQRSYEGLTICPSCGRTLRVALSRWITWGIPAALAALLFVSIWGISGRSPIALAMEAPQRVVTLISNLGSLIEPRVTDPEAVLNQQATAEQGAILASGSNPQPAIPQNSADSSGAVAVVTPVPVADQPPQPVANQVADGQVADAQLAQPQTNTSSENDGQPEQPLDEQPVEPTVNPTSTPVALPQSTNVLVTQAEPTAEEVEPTATNTPLPTVAPTATPAPTTEYRSDPLVLQSPALGATLDCATENSISWQAPVSVVATDKYVLNLGYISGQSDNQYIVTWIAKQKFSFDKTSWILDPAYCRLAPEEYQDQWIWYMQVIDEDDKIISAPSDTSFFIWRKPL